MPLRGIGAIILIPRVTLRSPAAIHILPLRGTGGGGARCDNGNAHIVPRFLHDTDLIAILTNGYYPAQPAPQKTNTAVGGPDVSTTNSVSRCAREV